MILPWGPSGFRETSRAGRFLRTVPVRPQTYSVHSTGLLTGMSNQEPKGHQMEILSGEPEGQTVKGSEMNLKDETRLGLATLWVQEAPVSAYEDNCPLRPVKTSRYSLKWTTELESPRRGVR